MTFRPEVLRCEPGRELRWLGHFLVPGLFDGEHAHLLEGLFGFEPHGRGAALFSGFGASDFGP